MQPMSTSASAVMRLALVVRILAATGMLTIVSADCVSIRVHVFRGG